MMAQARTIDENSSLLAKDVEEALASVDWDFQESPKASGAHALHSYPAKFIPDIPRSLIELLSRPSDLVLDPFCGGGTTGVESIAAGRTFLGIDANAFAVLLSRLKIEAIGDATLDVLLNHTSSIASRTPVVASGDWRPEIPNVDKWYDPVVFDDLAALRASVLSLPDSHAVDLGLLALASAAAKLSFQDSETRYVSKPRTMALGVTAATYLREVRRMVALVPRVGGSVDSRVILGDARAAASYESIAASSVGLAITSPPYPNAYDYHLYHRFRLFWLGNGPKGLRDVEVGSHLKNQTNDSPSESYLSDMGRMFKEVRRVLRDGAYFALVVGDGLHKGKIFETATELSRLAETFGFTRVACVDRQLPTSRRSVTQAGRRLQTEQILVLKAYGSAI